MKTEKKGGWGLCVNRKKGKEERSPRKTNKNVATPDTKHKTQSNDHQRMVGLVLAVKEPTPPTNPQLSSQKRMLGPGVETPPSGEATGPIEGSEKKLHRGGETGCVFSVWLAKKGGIGNLRKK